MSGQNMNSNNGLETEYNLNEKNISDDKYIVVVFIAYLGFLATLFLSNSLATNFFFYSILAPIALAPISWQSKTLWGIRLVVPQQITVKNQARALGLCRDWAAIALFVYVLDKCLLAIFLPAIDFKYYYYITEYLLPILLFFIISIRLIVDVPRFYYLFFTFLTPIIALNAGVNIYKYAHIVSDITLFQDLRLSPTFGAGVDEAAATSAGFSYAFYLFGGLMTLFFETDKKLKWLLIISVVILSLALLLTQTRGAFIALTLSLVVVTVFLNKKFKIAIILTLSMLLGSFLMLPKIRNYALMRGDNQRLELWSKFSKIIKERVLLGYGERGFGRGSEGEPHLFNVVLNSGETIHHAHNIFINAQLRGGLIALFALVYIVIRGFYVSYSCLRMEQNPIPFGSLLMLVIAGSVDFELHIFPAAWMWTTAWMPIIFVVGLCVRNSYAPHKNEIILN